LAEAEGEIGAEIATDDVVVEYADLDYKEDFTDEDPAVTTGDEQYGETENWDDIHDETSETIEVDEEQSKNGYKPSDEGTAEWINYRDSVVATPDMDQDAEWLQDADAQQPWAIGDNDEQGRFDY
jgi:hypothetical protein